MSNKNLAQQDLLKHIYSQGVDQNDEQEQFDEDYLDETILAAIRGGHIEFIQGLEKFLNEFIESKEKQTEKLHKLNKFQRKIVHKICDRYSISRDFVEVKYDVGTMSLSKQSISQIPKLTVCELYEQNYDQEDEQQFNMAKMNNQGPFMNPQLGGFMNPQMMNPQMMNPQMMNPQMMNPQMMNPQMMNPQMMNMFTQYMLQMQQQQRVPQQGVSQSGVPQQGFNQNQNAFMKQPEQQNFNQQKQTPKFNNDQDEFPSL